MSDKKTPTNPSRHMPEQEFDRFLRGEDTAIAATYRKLPTAEPDAQLDARVRALARHALRESPPAVTDTGSSDGARGDTSRTRGARWLPAFASAGVLVLAAGVVWQLGPRNWARKETATDIALDATIAKSAAPAATDASPRPAANAAPGAPPVDAGGAAAAAKSAGALQPNAADFAKAPLAFPAQTSAPKPPRPRLATPAVSSASPASSAQAQARKQVGARDAATPAERSRAPDPTEAAREKRVSDAPGDLTEAPAGPPPANTPTTNTAPDRAERPATDDRVATNGAVRSPAPVAATRVVPAPPAPPPPPVLAKTTPLPDQTVVQEATPTSVASTMPPPASTDSARANAFPAAAAPPAPPAGARRQDEVMTRQAPQRAATAAENKVIGAKARPAPAPAAATPPPSSPMQAPASPGAFAPAPSGATDAQVSKPKASAAASANDSEAQQQAYADHFALPPGSPPAKIPGRPTPAQLAAWPAPNCHAAGTVTSSGIGMDARTWSYPPDVPDSAQRRFVIVKDFLEAESPEGARKAYADFRHCYPDDRWPPSLLRRLGVQ